MGIPNLALVIHRSILSSKQRALAFQYGAYTDVPRISLLSISLNVYVLPATALNHYMPTDIDVFVVRLRCDNKFRRS